MGNEFLTEFYLHISVAGFVLLFIATTFFKFYFSRHQRNIRTARRVLNKIRSWDGDNVNARIFGYLRKIDPFVFEELLLESFKSQGYRIKRNARYTGAALTELSLKTDKNT